MDFNYYIPVSYPLLNLILFLFCLKNVTPNIQAFRSKIFKIMGSMFCACSLLIYSEKAPLCVCVCVWVSDGTRNLPCPAPLASRKHIPVRPVCGPLSLPARRRNMSVITYKNTPQTMRPLSEPSLQNQPAEWMAKSSLIIYFHTYNSMFSTAMTACTFQWSHMIDVKSVTVESVHHPVTFCYHLHCYRSIFVLQQNPVFPPCVSFTWTSLWFTDNETWRGQQSWVPMKDE